MRLRCPVCGAHIDMLRHEQECGGYVQVREEIGGCPSCGWCPWEDPTAYDRANAIRINEAKRRGGRDRCPIP